MRSVVEVEEINNRTCLVVTELPYQVNPDNLAMKIADLVKDAKIGGIADVRDEGKRAARGSGWSSCSSATPWPRSC
jgi:DNA gyrase subunit A